MKILLPFFALFLANCTTPNGVMMDDATRSKGVMGGQFTDAQPEAKESRLARIGVLLETQDYEALGWKKVGENANDSNQVFAGRHVLVVNDDSKFDGRKVFCEQCENNLCRIFYSSSGSRMVERNIPAEHFAAVKAEPSAEKVQEFKDLVKKSDYDMLDAKGVKAKHKEKSMLLLIMTESLDGDIIKGTLTRYTENQLVVLANQSGSTVNLPIDFRNIKGLAVKK